MRCCFSSHGTVGFPLAPRIAATRILQLTGLLRQYPCRCSASVAGVDAQSDEHYMGLALQQAAEAFASDEVPIGAVLVSGSEVISMTYNKIEQRRNPLCHAELLCITAAAEKMQAWRLQDATLYCTLEPCPMCAGAILQARLKRLVYGAKQPRIGADGSWVALFPQQQQQRQQQQQQQQQGTCSGQTGMGREANVHEQFIPAASPLMQQHQQATASPEGLPAEPLEQMQLSQQPQQQQQQQQRLHHHHDHQQQQQHSPGCIAPNSRHPFHPNIQVTSGVREAECRSIMQQFFKKRRQQQRKDPRAVNTQIRDVTVAEAAKPELVTAV